MRPESEREQRWTIWVCGCPGYVHEDPDEDEPVVCSRCKKTIQEVTVGHPPEQGLDRDALGSPQTAPEEGKSYEERKVAPFMAYIGATLAGVTLMGEEGSEPDELCLSFQGRPDVVVSIWHGMGGSGFDIEGELGG